ncbi:LCP family protein [uncultured Jatrophihabitans sp.]|uniref:LCP family protein n=1 Tax=uncultured Jatrophihabitans sp. TaxID=1610747 RepID=UPI0035CAB506
MPTNPRAADPNEPLPAYLDPRGRHRGRRTSGGHGKGSAARVALSVGALISVALLVLAGYSFYTFRNINNGIHRLDPLSPADPTNAAGQKATPFNGKDQNILLVGNDDRTNMTAAERHQLHTSADGGSRNTDTMMILHLPANGKQATIISLPRDSYVHIDGEGMNRLNSAYPYGYANNAPSNASVDDRRQAGAKLLVKTVQQLTGLTINHYVQISLLGFYEISNAIGGVPIDLCHSVNDTHAYNVANGQPGGSGFKMSKGKHIIKGVTALEFVRQRHFLPRGDLDRVRRQQYFLTSAFRQVASVGIFSKLNSLGDAVKRNIYLDGSLNLLDLARQMEALSANNISGKTIPTTEATIDGSDVLEVNPTKVQAYVQKVLNPPLASPSPSPSTSRSTSAGSSASPKPSASTSAAIDAKCVN